MCKNCHSKPIIELFTKKYCKSCFVKYFERKVYRTINNYDLISKNDKIGVALSGGKDSLTLLYLLNKFRKNKQFELLAISVDEGIEGYRDASLEHAKKICKQLNIKINVYSYEKLLGKSLDSIMKNKDIHSCSVCGVLRRNILNTNARNLGLTRLATGHNLDDEAQSILMNQFRNNMAVSARLGPITGIKDNEKLVKRIKPLYFMSEKEVMTYAYIKNILPEFKECPYQADSYRNYVRNMLNSLEQKFPGTKNAIVNSFMDIHDLLKKEYINIKINNCKVCGEPTSRETCQACVTIQTLSK